MVEASSFVNVISWGNAVLRNLEFYFTVAVSRYFDTTAVEYLARYIVI